MIIIIHPSGKYGLLTSSFRTEWMAKIRKCINQRKCQMRQMTKSNVKEKLYNLESTGIVDAVSHRDDVKASIARNRKIGDSPGNEKFRKVYEKS